MTSPKKIISFDIGIKNMAFCIFTVPDPKLVTDVSINLWTVINLMEDPDNTTAPVIYSCSCLKTKKRKGDADILCGKTAKYSKPVGQQILYFCETHSKKSGFFLPKNEYLPTSLKKKKVIDLIKTCEKYGISAEKMPKSGLVDKMSAFFEKRCLELISMGPAKKTAGETDLITIGRNMAKCMDRLSAELQGVTHVLMENQISTLASRMKTIQGMLAQYFIMRIPEAHIEFISSFNKLKIFGGNGNPTDSLIPVLGGNGNLTDSLIPVKPPLIGGKPPVKPPLSVNVNETLDNIVLSPPSAGGDKNIDETLDNIVLSPPSAGGDKNIDETLENKVITPPSGAGGDKDPSVKNTYKQHKLDGVFYAKQLLDQYPNFGDWKSALETKKKDDLADSFLQGWWYITTKL